MADSESKGGHHAMLRNAPPAPGTSLPYSNPNAITETALANGYIQQANQRREAAYEKQEMIYSEQLVNLMQARDECVAAQQRSAGARERSVRSGNEWKMRTVPYSDVPYEVESPYGAFTVTDIKSHKAYVPQPVIDYYQNYEDALRVARKERQRAKAVSSAARPKATAPHP